ncbi:carbohydrate ABC transporter permease [Oharaeibacter diazotrophicus]|uniref:Sorbitol ABC transporter membrane protein /mannitol ABC transporter membrane protein n=1 Tax=Oharaeibacter diazotrophicus TaxID=1920512 RepID=A0A4R6RFM6_9HYPH|nr:sugar ABC transporter permease [Oharaeibacter diazotrophicus]TDP85042.1 sorbitol ABC transporter membrane protein /mannitol ABC transporter membrane protein [Oharaeibacter diazotrophicus]BBE74012.1 sn-glycerol-3-phosphate transport system permease protein UgpA [Pleomorphomonas sp. SM30]GLS76300.1 ABC transporter permease [Oharaeibacter diazotrophicus]
MTNATIATPRRARGGRAVRTGPLLAPAVTLLLLWMIVPLAMTLWFSLQRYNLLNPMVTGFAGLRNYELLFTTSAIWISIWNTLVLVGSVLIVTIVFGVFFAVLFDQPFFGRDVARLLVIAPFFVMPTVSALIWKNLLMHPVNGLFAWIAKSLGFPAVDWFTNLPMTSIVIIVAWQWIPFATLILLTAMQSLDREQMEAARMDGAKGPAMLWHIVLPHLMRPISVVVMIECIFLLAVFAEIQVTTSGGPGTQTSTLTYFIYIKALLRWDVGGASAAGVVAIVLANIVAAFLIRTVARNLDK